MALQYANTFPATTGSGDESKGELPGSEGKDSGAATRLRGQHQTPRAKQASRGGGKAGFLVRLSGEEGKEELWSEKGAGSGIITQDSIREMGSNCQVSFRCLESVISRA